MISDKTSHEDGTALAPCWEERNRKEIYWVLCVVYTHKYYL